MINEISKSIIIQYLQAYNPEEISVFGSFARGENNIDSDLDILVHFKNPISLLQLIKAENELSDKLNIKVDLVSTGSLSNNRFKATIEKDLKPIYRA